MDSSAAWAQAAILDPRNPRVLIPAGINAELRGDLLQAKGFFEQAERYNRTWLPRWTLANYYARRGDRARTVEHLRAAFERSYGATYAAFQLAVDVGVPVVDIPRLLLPDSANAHAQFVYFLSDKPVTGETATWIARSAVRYAELSAALAGRDPAPVLHAVNRLLQSGFGSLAREAWNKGCERGLIASTPANETPIVNGDFERAFLSTGFDWFMPPQLGVDSLHHPGPGTVKFTFSGSQQPDLEMLSQTVVLPPGKGWRVKYEFQTREIDPRQAAFVWTLDGVEMPAGRPLSSEVWMEGSFEIAAPDRERVARLQLRYTRPVGATRPEGQLWIRRIRAEPAP
ncbi:MAG: hypothetical protein SFV18_13235 [Bryobacteraceae bacterium]|nr:hypothetical protein [Bryobacteraceae bacterium]